jgi:hypothetical protein
MGEQRTAALRQMTAEQLRYLGTRQMVYLRAEVYGGEPTLVLCGADGSSLVLVDSLETAAEMVAEHGLSIAAIH